MDEVTGERIQDPDTLERIREIVIPPAWEDVWICPWPNGHVQAVGTDARGRKQYRYHQRWRERRDAEKFDEMLEFARALPRLRAVTGEHLRAEKLSRERVLAGAVRLLDRGFFRIGGEAYAAENETYGLATMKKHHARVDGERIVFAYVAKAGKQQVQEIVDAEIAGLVAALKRRRSGSDELLAYRNGRAWADVRSIDINAYIKAATGADFSAKDFRTWNATVLAAVNLARDGRAAASRTARKRAINGAVKEVADYLGNTPAVCRASYIDPRVWDRYRSGWTIWPVLEGRGEVDFGRPESRRPIEEGVLDLLEDERDSEALERVRAA